MMMMMMIMIDTVQLSPINRLLEYLQIIMDPVSLRCKNRRFKTAKNYYRQIQHRRELTTFLSVSGLP